MDLLKVNPLVTVIIPSYNRFELLCYALLSVEMQTYTPIEIIVADDCSPDPRYQPEYFTDRGIKYVRTHHNTRTPAEPRNLALEQATGQYVAMLDDDDQFLPNHIANGVEFLESHPECSMCCSEAYYNTNEPIYHSDHHYPLTYGEVHRDFVLQHTGNEKLKSFLTAEDMKQHNWVINSSVLLRREVIDWVGKFRSKLDTGIFEDYDFWRRMTAYGLIGFLPKPTICYNAMPNWKWHHGT